MALDRRPDMTRLTIRDRFLAWLVTGPVGRLVAFVWDFVEGVRVGVANKLGRR
jgi:hypothetical protein